MKSDVYTFKNLSAYPEIIHGFSTSAFGNLKVEKRIAENKQVNKFLNALNVKSDNLVVGEQVHRGKVVVVGDTEAGTVISGADGLISPSHGIFLGVNVADCLPIMVYDSKMKIVAVCHAGWQGTLNMIAEELIAEMKKLGSQPKNLILGIGPHIKSCCYDVGEDRAEIFQEKFGKKTKAIELKNGKFYLNLTDLNVSQLKQAGVDDKNIEISPYCTFCGGGKFFSYRRLGPPVPEIMGIIGR